MLPSALRLIVRAASGLFAAALAVNAAQARPLEEVRQKGEISVCAHPNALPYASDKPDAPGFQIEIARAIAAKMGVRLRVDWIVPTMRASMVDCDLLMDAIVDPAVRRPGVQLSTPYQTSGVSLVFAAGQAPVAAYRDLRVGMRVGVLMNSLASLIVSRTPASIVPVRVRGRSGQRSVARRGACRGGLAGNHRLLQSYAPRFRIALFARRGQRTRSCAGRWRWACAEPMPRW